MSKSYLIVAAPLQVAIPRDIGHIRARNGEQAMWCHSL